MSRPRDWADLGRKLDAIQARMIHEEHSPLRGAGFTGEALRRLLEHPGCGFVTRDEHERVLEANRFTDRANGERAQAQLRQEREEHARRLADARHVLADAIRARVNERTIPSALRREGALLAADWLDPQQAGSDPDAEAAR